MGPLVGNVPQVGCSSCLCLRPAPLRGTLQGFWCKHFFFFFCTVIPGNAGRGEGKRVRGEGKARLAGLGWGWRSLSRGPVNRAQSPQEPLGGARDSLQQGGSGRLEVFIRHCCPSCVRWFGDVQCLTSWHIRHDSGWARLSASTSSMD